MLGDTKRLFKKIKSMSKNINLSLFKDFLESLLVDYARYLINLKNTTENKDFVTEAKNRISSLKDRIKEMSKKAKRK